MLADGVRVQLYIGPAVPIPVSRDVLDSLESVEVHAGSGETQGGFELTFRLSRRSPLHTVFLLTGGSSIPLVRVVIVALLGGSAEVLVDGVMTKHEVRDAGGADATLVIEGKDLSALMDMVVLDGLPFPGLPTVARVLLCLAKYAPFGVIPMAIPPIIEDIPLPIERIPHQQGSDYEYLTRLATEAGYVFYLEPGPVVGVSRAYWGPEIRVGVPQPALNLDLDQPHRNVESLSFQFDKEKKELPLVYIQEQYSKAPLLIPVPSEANPLSPPLGLIPPLPPKITKLADTGKLKPWVAALHGLAYASRHADAVIGSGTLDVARYGRILRSRQLVGVRGAGEAFDGLHFVSSVSHTIKRGEYKQSFTLARNGLLSTLPKVPT